VRVTPIVVVAGDAVGVVIVMVPVYVLAIRVVGSAVTCKVVGMVPREELMVSQLALDEAVNARPGTEEARVTT
jgi:hypothetical protein